MARQNQHPCCATVSPPVRKVNVSTSCHPAARRHKQIYLQAIDQLKSVAGQAAARVADFRRLFGVALVNLDAFIKTA